MTDTDKYVWPCLSRNGRYGRIYLSLPRAKELLTEIALEFPTRVGRPYHYYDESGEVCDPIALLLERVGYVDKDHLQPKGQGGTVWRVLHEEILLGDLGTKTLLNHVQRGIDNGRSWSRSIELAIRWVDNNPTTWSWSDSGKEETIRNQMIASGEVVVV